MSLTAEERQHALRELRDQEAALQDRPTPEGAWTIAESCEHLDKVDHQIFRLLQSPMLCREEPAPASAWDDNTLFDHVASPGRAVASPQGIWKSTDEFWAAYRVFRQQMRTWIETTDAPLLGVLDGYQGLLFVAAHGHRHSAQILERGQ